MSLVYPLGFDIGEAISTQTQFTMPPKDDLFTSMCK